MFEHLNLYLAAGCDGAHSCRSVDKVMGHIRANHMTLKQDDVVEEALSTEPRSERVNWLVWIMWGFCAIPVLFGFCSGILSGLVL